MSIKEIIEACALAQLAHVTVGTGRRTTPLALELGPAAFDALCKAIAASAASAIEDLTRRTS